jgi:hypothetical protein
MTKERAAEFGRSFSFQRDFLCKNMTAEARRGRTGKGSQRKKARE